MHEHVKKLRKVKSAGCYQSTGDPLALCTGPCAACQCLKRGSLAPHLGCHLVSQEILMLPLMFAADMCMTSGCRITTSPACVQISRRLR